MNYLLQHSFTDIAKKMGEKTALIIDRNYFSYQTIYEDVLKFSDYLKSHQVKKGDRVWIQSGNSYLTIIAFWGAFFCDAIACPIDPSTPENIHAQLVASLKPKIMITLDRHESILDHLKKSAVSVQNFTFQNTEQDLAMIMHTSGSTGVPKGVMLSHRNVLSAVESIRTYLTLQNSDVILCALPMHFDYGLYQMLLAFTLGATLILEENAVFPHIIAHHIQKHSVTIVPCVPAMAQMFYVCQNQFKCDFSTVRIVTNTGENLSKGQIEKLKIIFLEPVARKRGLKAPHCSTV